MLSERLINELMDCYYLARASFKERENCNIYLVVKRSASARSIYHTTAHTGDLFIAEKHEPLTNDYVFFETVKELDSIMYTVLWNYLKGDLNEEGYDKTLMKTILTKLQVKYEALLEDAGVKGDIK